MENNKNTSRRFFIKTVCKKLIGITCGFIFAKDLFSKGKKINSISLIEDFAYCGLFCGACKYFLAKECFGCKSNKPPSWSVSCQMRICAISKKVSYCAECSKYPCEIISSYYGNYIKQGNLYRILAKNNSEMIRKKGAVNWLEVQKKRWRCPKCGNNFSWIMTRCSKCHTKIYSLEDEAKDIVNSLNNQ